MKIIIIMIMSFFVLFSAQGADPKTNWANNCMQCHGPDGSANTSMGKALNAKDLTSAQIQSSFNDTRGGGGNQRWREQRRYDDDDRIRRQTDRR